MVVLSSTKMAFFYLGSHTLTEIRLELPIASKEIRYWHIDWTSRISLYPATSSIRRALKAVPLYEIRWSNQKHLRKSIYLEERLKLHENSHMLMQCQCYLVCAISMGMIPFHHSCTYGTSLKPPGSDNGRTFDTIMYPVRLYSFAIHLLKSNLSLDEL